MRALLVVIMLSLVTACTRVLRVGTGREMHVFASAGATLRGVCQGLLVNTLNGFITAGSGRFIAPTPP